MKSFHPSHLIYHYNHYRPCYTDVSCFYTMAVNLMNKELNHSSSGSITKIKILSDGKFGK